LKYSKIYHKFAEKYNSQLKKGSNMKKLVFFISLSLLILVGCDKQPGEHNYERTIWTNPDVECCGVKDPINNLAWLKKWYEDSYFNEEKVLDYEEYAEFIFVYENDSSKEDMIVRKIIYNNTMDWYYIYYCDGEWLTNGTYYGENINKVSQKNYSNNIQYTSIDTECPLCEEFFNTHVLIDTIAMLYTDKFKF
jgi:hypothetical protein